MKAKENDHYDRHSVMGRAVLDSDVARTLSKMPRSAGDAAEALGLDRHDIAVRRMMSACFRRLVRDGKADPSGENGGRRYAKPPRGSR